MQRQKLKFSRLPGSHAIVQLAAGSSIPDWATKGDSPRSPALPTNSPSSAPMTISRQN